MAKTDSEAFIEAVELLDKEGRLLRKIVVWLRSKKFWNECMLDINEKQLIDKDLSESHS